MINLMMMNERVFSGAPVKGHKQYTNTIVGELITVVAHTVRRSLMDNVVQVLISPGLCIVR